MSDSDRPRSPFAGMADFSARPPVRMLSRDEIEQMLAAHRLYLETEYHQGHRANFASADLSGQDFWTLLASGHRPVGLVMGSCVYHVAHQGMFASMRQIGQNIEMPNFTQALYDARELAMERMQKEAEALQAEGIVGVQLQERSHGWGSHVIEFFAIGTAIVPSPGEGQLPTPTPTISLND